LAKFIREQKVDDRRVVVSCAAQSDPNLHQRIKSDSRSFIYPNANIEHFDPKFHLVGSNRAWTAFEIIEDCNKNEDSPWIELLTHKNEDAIQVPSAKDQASNNGRASNQNQAGGPVRPKRTRIPVVNYTEKTFSDAKKPKRNPYYSVRTGSSGVSSMIRKMKPDVFNTILGAINSGNGSQKAIIAELDKLAAKPENKKKRKADEAVGGT
jgi:hypothetical protein